MANKTKFGFGNSSDVERAIQEGKINARDVLFLDEDSDNPKIGWVTKSGKAVILTDEKADLSEIEADVEALELELTKKANANEVEAKIAEKADVSEVDEKIGKVVTDAKAYTDGKVEAAVNEHLIKKYEITSLPNGTLIDYREDEIRIMCPKDAVFTKQSVGTGGNPNSYYMTFKTYYPNKDVVGYMEHLGDLSDSEILTKSSTDKYGRVYQTTWLALADYDASTDSWIYRGKESSKDGYYGYDYQIDWYNADGVMIASDSIRINLANEDCYFASKPYYVGEIKKEIDTKIEERIAEVESAWEIVEF